MNQLDKKLYKNLSYFADLTRTEIEEQNKTKIGEESSLYRENVNEVMEMTFENWGYINWKSDAKWVITKNGLEQLRQLEEIRHRHLTLWDIDRLHLCMVHIFASIFILHLRETLCPAL